jgi:hypothetical protein
MAKSARALVKAGAEATPSPAVPASYAQRLRAESLHGWLRSLPATSHAALERHLPQRGFRRVADEGLAVFVLGSPGVGGLGQRVVLFPNGGVSLATFLPGIPPRVHVIRLDRRGALSSYELP